MPKSETALFLFLAKTLQAKGNMNVVRYHSNNIWKFWMNFINFQSESRQLSAFSSIPQPIDFSSGAFLWSVIRAVIFQVCFIFTVILFVHSVYLQCFSRICSVLTTFTELWDSLRLRRNTCTSLAMNAANSCIRGRGSVQRHFIIYRDHSRTWLMLETNLIQLAMTHVGRAR